jgi:peroxiredoxin
MMKLMIRLTTLIGFLLVSLYANAGAISGKAPDFTLKSNKGKNLRLSDYRGQVVMLNFWASWCGPCRQEMPILDQLQSRYAKLGFTLLGVNVEEDSSKANAYLKDIPVSFPILYDTANQTSKLYNVSAMPTTVIIDRNGNMRFIHHGYKPGYEKDYKKQIKALIRE